MKNTKLSLALAGILACSSASFADDREDIAQLKKEIAELKETTQSLIDETSDLKTGFNYTTVDTDKSHSGLGAAASKVYYSKSPLSIGGYGEMYYSTTNSDDDTEDSSETQVKRLITYLGYKFSDNIILNTEIEYEGGGVTASGGGDEVVVEFMYIDFLMNKNYNFRVGNMLMPVGLTNQRHEPTLFTTVQRPQTAYYLIPTTWNESGAMIYGEITEGLEYKLAGVSALQPDDTAGAKWLRKGRGSSFEVKNPGFAGVARLDYTGINGLLVGASVYNDSKITMWDAHMNYENSGARLYGTYTQTKRSDTTAAQVKEMSGGYINASFDLLTLTSYNKKLPVFIQYERVNPQEKLADGTTNSAINTTTVGINFFPHEQVVLKMDYAMADNDFANTGTNADTFSISMGFIF
ncbi:porin [Sulfurimonas paralvinellae]|uniref:Porin n=1 Tax=Sulfurimonas paralvinellae TaxID=317658 RepID=A0A7M1BAN7_9BACT|nr:porin [Sulfurimonas paralvinellae]QOP45822.1 porin [Sulfurimonas paralvinellae]